MTAYSNRVKIPQETKIFDKEGRERVRDEKEASELVKNFKLERILFDNLLLRGIGVPEDTRFSLTVEVDEKNRYWPVFEIHNSRQPNMVKIPFDCPVPIEILPLNEALSLKRIMFDGMRFICVMIAALFVARADYIIMSLGFNEKGETCLNIEFIFSSKIIFKGSVPLEQAKGFVYLEKKEDEKK